MTPLRLFAIGFIFVCTTVAWMILGAAVTNRSGEADGTLRAEVERLWGGEHVQHAPTAALVNHDVDHLIPDYDVKGKKIGEHHAILRDPYGPNNERLAITLAKSDVRVGLDLEHRRKGLLWFPTYAVGYESHYRFENGSKDTGDGEIGFTFPSTQGIYDGFVFKVNGKEAPGVTDLSRGAVVRMQLAPGDVIDVDVAYRSRGIGTWSYLLGDGVSQAKDFSLALVTNNGDVDFPSGSMSPSSRSSDGKQLAWKFANLVTGQRISVELPSRLNPGPVAARISFFAPVSLLFFFTVMVILGVVRNRNLHPMNYFFLASGFFAFHLLLAYLVDVVDIFAAFGISAAASVILVLSYLRIVMGHRAAWIQAGAAQLVFLVLFSCAFFVEGQTGLSIAVGATLTLFVLMQLTARVKWSEVFDDKPSSSGSPIGVPSSFTSSPSSSTTPSSKL